jgi:hypothetical protein
VSVNLMIPDELLDAIAERVAAKAGAARPSSPWHDAESAAVYLCTTEKAVRRAEERGLLKGYRTADVRGVLRFHEEDLDRYARGR